MNGAQDYFKIKEVVIIVLHLYQFVFPLLSFRLPLFGRMFLGRLWRISRIVLLVLLAHGLIILLLHLGNVTMS